ncbi:Uncharacterised protein [Pluralibacter gergoviae]|nr:Uncharacterised protein [Pluralibacter gergoviae]
MSQAPWTLFCPRTGLTPTCGLPRLPVRIARLVSDRTVSTPCQNWVTPMPHRMVAVFAVAYIRAQSRICRALRPVIASTDSGV